MEKIDTKLILLPLPVEERIRKVKAKKLKERLSNSNFEELVQSELENIYRWPDVRHLSTRRYYRNLTLVYSKEELESSIRLLLNNIFGTNLKKAELDG